MTKTASACRGAGVETYLAPPPPREGKIVGVDCHPDTFTAAVFTGQTPHDARKLASRENLSMDGLMEWAAREFGPQDLLLLEAGSNSFEVCARLHALGLRAAVLESCHVGKHAKTYADNDKMAAARIALVYLAGNAPCVWVPDAASRQRRELLHAYRKAVGDDTAASNSLKGFLTGEGVRLTGRNPALQPARNWILRSRNWSALQVQILSEHFADIDACGGRRKRLYRLICQEMAEEPLMLRCMKVLGVGIVSAFGLLAAIGDVRRFQRPEKLVAYLGLNPGRRCSGRSKNVKVGVGGRGRGDVRYLLVQGAQAVLRTGARTPLGSWGWRLFARKGNRNVAVAAVARKLAVQIWHVLSGNPPIQMEHSASLEGKLRKLAVALGTRLRTSMGLGTIPDCIGKLHELIARAGMPQQSG